MPAESPIALRTLIVDDNRGFRRDLRDVLRAQYPAMDVAEAASGEQMWEALAAQVPDLIFVDISMPGESGLQLSRRIKAQHPHVVIVMVTVHDLPEYRTAAREHGADYFFAKGTLSPRNLFELIDEVLAHRD